MRRYFQIAALTSSLLVAGVALSGCSPEEGTGGKMDGGAMSSGKTDGEPWTRARWKASMDKDKMDGGAMPSDKMEGAWTRAEEGGAMDKGKMDGSPK